MKPRIFVSSTYYDLKYIRNNISNFINQYGFDPVLFESGDITFKHNSPLDRSCYDEVKLCHMMILIIGGRYGAEGSKSNQGSKVDLEKYEKEYEDEYVSITRQEFETAVKENIPIYIFIDKNVYAEYETFKKNEKNSNIISQIKFAHVDSTNVFKFIGEINKMKYQAISQFEKIEDITDYLQVQWAGLFYNYLNDIKLKSKDERILDSVLEIKNISQSMERMVDKLAEKQLDDSDYKKIIEEQQKDLVVLFIEQICSRVKIYSSDDEECRRIAENIYSYILEDKYKILDMNTSDFQKQEIDNIIEKIIDNTKNAILVENDMYDIKYINEYYKYKMKKMIDQNPKLKEILIKELATRLWSPF